MSELRKFSTKAAKPKPRALISKTHEAQAFTLKTHETNTMIPQNPGSKIETFRKPNKEKSPSSSLCQKQRDKIRKMRGLFHETRGCEYDDEEEDLLEDSPFSNFYIPRLVNCLEYLTGREANFALQKSTRNESSAAGM